VNAAFALFQIDWVRRQVPMHDSVTVLMEVQTLLSHRSAGEYERPEWRVECRPYLIAAGLLCDLAGSRLAGLCLIGGLLAEAHCKTRPDTTLLHEESSGSETTNIIGA
jgi:hypothetical protein